MVIIELMTQNRCVPSGLLLCHTRYTCTLWGIIIPKYIIKSLTSFTNSKANIDDVFKKLDKMAIENIK